VDKILKPFRKGETKDVVEKLENHFDQLDEILNKVQSRSIPLIDFAVLQVFCMFLLFNPVFNYRVFVNDRIRKYWTV
jgi:transcription termination factor NusB